MNPERISSLHDDLLVPKATEHLGEYSDYPERFDPSEKSVLTRLEQFGIDLTQAQEEYGKEIKDFSWEDYEGLVAKAIKVRYDIIVGSVFDQYMFPTTENPEESERWEKMLKLVERYENMDAKFGLNLVKRKADIQEGGNLVMGLEAGAHLIKSLADLKKLQDQGIKLFGFQYGKETPLAGPEGLSKFGVESARYLLDNNLIIDLAHSGYKTRQGIMQIAKDTGKGNLISYTHGSSEADIVEKWRDKVGERALKPEEIQEIIKNGGIIGLGVSEPFFSSTQKIAERIDDISQLEGGIDHLALGTDFGGVAPEFLKEIKKPEDLKVLADILAGDFKMDEADIDKVIRTNAKEWIKSAID
jgi:microsomal dipeptidase-like Zn-dependent dipeptidase